jgi:hypothetical protein
MAIFGGAAMSVAVMGGIIEVCKLTGISLYYHKSKQFGWRLKSTLLACLLAAMFITSIGVFGFLSKAHIQQTTSIGNNDTRIERIDLSVERYNRDITRSEKVLDQFDGALEKYVELGAVSKGLKKREEQDSERVKLNKTILNAETEIDKLLSERSELQREIKNVEAEIGPVRYISELLYDNPDSNQLDDAVRYVTLILVLLLDPFAVVLLIAANASFSRRNKDLKKDLQEHSKNATISESVIETNEDGIRVSEVITSLPPLKSVTEDEFNELKENGVLWDYYPDASDTYENTMSKLKKQTYKVEGQQGETYV